MSSVLSSFVSPCWLYCFYRVLIITAKTSNYIETLASHSPSSLLDIIILYMYNNVCEQTIPRPKHLRTWSICKRCKNYVRDTTNGILQIICSICKALLKINDLHYKYISGVLGQLRLSHPSRTGTLCRLGSICIDLARFGVIGLQCNNPHLP